MAASPRRVIAGLCAAVLAVLPLSACGAAVSAKDNANALHRVAMEAAGSWLRVEAIPFDTVEPTGGLDDLEPLRHIVGEARIVSLGEATHGTSEFFKMKHRILRFLAERMGFTAFAIEATWPEANRLDRYVRTGAGDPAVLLSGLYFWTWNTQEVLDMIEWMRSWNQAGGNAGFYGFDMQYPGMAIDNITKFVAAVDGNSSADFAQHMDCLARYANGPNGRFPSPAYGAESQAYRDACRQDLQWVADTLLARQAEYEAASSHGEWATAAQSATVAIQYEEMTSNRRSRDLAMADNVKWLVDEMPPDGKIVLWAHNGHVGTAGSGAYRSMGAALRDTFGQDMVVVCFDFARGSFNAHGQTGSTVTALATHTVGEPPRYSYEDYFLSAGMPRFLLDVRGRDQRPGTPAWLAGPHLMRSIGAVYNDGAPDSYLYQTYLPSRCDVIIFLENTSPSQLLPFKYPPEFEAVVAGDSAAQSDSAAPRGVWRADGSASDRPGMAGSASPPQGVIRRDFSPRK